MKKIAVAALSFILSSEVGAEPVGFAVGASGGPLYRMVAAIATVVGGSDNVEIRTRPHAGSAQMMPVVNSGEVDCGLANGLDLQMAYAGEGIYEGSPYPNLRLVGVTYPFRLTLMVTADSGISRPEDVRGLRVPGPFKASPAGDILVEALLANAGLSTGDVQQIPVTGFRESLDEFGAGRLDVIVDAASDPTLKMLERKVGKMRALSVNTDPTSVAAMRRFMPVARVEEIAPRPHLVGVEEPVHVMAYDFFVFCHKDVSEKTVTRIAGVLHERRPDLAKILPPFATLNPDSVAPDIGVPYHPGAIGVYREKGIWKEPG